MDNNGNDEEYADDYITDNKNGKVSTPILSNSLNRFQYSVSLMRLLILKFTFIGV